MKRYFGFITVVVATIFFSGCLGSGGSSAPAPNNVKVVPKDSRVIVTWDMVSGVEYWIFHANGTGVTPENCSTMPLCYTTVNVTSPASVTTGLTNDLLFSFSINGRKNGGAGGPGSAAVQTSPRLSGEAGTWTLGTPPTTYNLRGVAYGASAAKFVAAGDSGALYSGSVYTIPDATLGATTGITWSPLTNPSTATFSAVSYDASGTKYLVAGSGGAILQSTDAVTWTLQTTATTKTGSDLYAVANNGASTFVATGATGTIITSLDGGTSWTAQTISGSPTLNSVTYGYVTALGVSRFVAVGASGKVFYSLDGVTWTTATSVSTTSEIKGVTYGLVSGVGTFVAVTADGKVITSTDGSTWTTPVSVSSALNAVTVSLNPVVPLSSTVTTVTNAFVTVDNTGNIFRSINGGVSWSNVYSGSTPLYAVTHGGLFDYSAVGASGVNRYAD
jgi:hypothetical protein